LAESPDGPNSLVELEDRVLAWGKSRKDVRAVMVIGSRARTDHPADEWADVDFAITVKDPQKYMANRRWLADIGETSCCYPDPNPAGATLHTLFRTGIYADFGFIPTGTIRQATTLVPWIRRLSPVLDRIPGHPLSGVRDQIEETGEYYRRGYRVLLDKDDVADKFFALFPPTTDPAHPPSSEEFSGVLNEFWFAVAWTAKHLRRGEIWWTIYGGWDLRLHPLLLRIIEWHAKALSGLDVDTWDEGRFLEEWADPKVVAALKGTYPDHDADATWDALFATMKLFRSIATETTERFGFDYLSRADEDVSNMVKRLYDGRPSAG
jgi:aminoglycoside 6-adenylyltransferase